MQDKRGKVPETIEGTEVKDDVGSNERRKRQDEKEREKRNKDHSPDPSDNRFVRHEENWDRSPDSGTTTGINRMKARITQPGDDGSSILRVIRRPLGAGFVEQGAEFSVIVVVSQSIRTLTKDRWASQR